MKNNLLLTFFISIFITINLSCDDNVEHNILKTSNTVDVNAINGRLSFKSSATFFKTIQKINSWNGSQLSNWEKQYKYTSLRTQVDTVNSDSVSLKRLPNSYQTILNKDGEVVIGDTIVWYTGAGEKHFILNSDESMLSKIRAGTAESTINDSYKISHPKLKGNNNIGNRIQFSGIDARWQKEFYFQNSSGSKRKYVNELYTYWDGDYTELYIRIKLEYWGKTGCCRHEWKVAGDQREISYTFNYNAFLLWGTIAYYGGYPLTFYGTKTGYYIGNSQQNIFLGSDYLTYSDTNKDWDVEISGTIYQYLINDYSTNAWTCTGYPLW